MRKTLNEYIDKIKKLPIKDKYTKEELLCEDFLIEKEGNIEIYYAPHNEYVNPKAKVFIVGITPGFQQMSTAISQARKSLEEGDSIEDIQYKCKVAGRFSGSLRKNIIGMLDEVKLNESLGLDSCKELFEGSDHLLHTISMIPYSVFVKENNYTGYTPKLVKSEFLMKYVYENFTEVLEVLVDKGILKDEQILKGFPHPSGANGHRLVQLRENKDNMIRIIEAKVSK
ncbi:hypothetical protein CHL78_011095 [Romboutsia weinsteinii]|uniref:Uncharacterized protein n=1 Tax=Romboutsia weinsteinii TaxID=2020949 RepID=A0A371J2W7_9FIRM|nr:hypothetical protein [Romboutsia weinsteinii]RDY27008.1 hypothetical protein CHL78_011095 [Romboutsia weinsteinii]